MRIDRGLSVAGERVDQNNDECGECDQNDADKKVAPISLTALSALHEFIV